MCSYYILVHKRVSQQLVDYFSLDYLQEKTKNSTLYGFKGGPAGIMNCKYVELTADFVYPYRNQVRNLLSIIHLIYMVFVCTCSKQFFYSKLCLWTFMEKIFFYSSYP